MDSTAVSGPSKQAGKASATGPVLGVLSQQPHRNLASQLPRYAPAKPTDSLVKRLRGPLSPLTQNATSGGGHVLNWVFED